MPAGASVAGVVAGDLNDALRQYRRLMREAGERLFGHRSHALHQGLDRSLGSLGVARIAP